MDFYRVEFYRVLDTVDAQTTEKFMQPGIQTLKELENSLLTSITNDAAVQKYPELNEEDLKVQLAMFKNKYKVSTTADAVHVLREMPPEVRGLFDQVETLVRLLMWCPYHLLRESAVLVGYAGWKLGCDQPWHKKDSMALLCAIFTKRGLTDWTDKKLPSSMFRVMKGGEMFWGPSLSKFVWLH